MAGAASFRYALGLNFRERIFRGPDPVNAVAAHALRGAAVMFVEQGVPVWTLLEFRELVRRQRRVEVVHVSRIGMATRAEGHDPFTVLGAIFLRPFLDMGVSELGRRIAAVATGAGNSASEMHVFDDLLQVHVRLRADGR